MLDMGIIIESLTHRGGAERLAMECIARWQHRHRLTIYSTVFDEDILYEHGISKKNVRMVSLPPLFEGAHSLVLNTVVLPRIWEQEIGRHQVYHAHQWPTHLIDRHPLVWYPHEPHRAYHDLRHETPLTGLANGLNRHLADHAKSRYCSVPNLAYEPGAEAVNWFDQRVRPERIVANSRYTARYLENVYGVPVTDVVYPGIDPSAFASVPAKENVFLAVGQLGWHKRFRLILEALVLAPEARLEIIGNGSGLQSLKRMALALGVSERVSFLRGLPNREVQKHLANCRAVLFTPLNEPFGIVALEALAAGKPLIAVDRGGYTEVVDESCARLVPAQPAAIAEQMRYFHEHPEAAERMGRAGRKIAANYSWDRTAEELLAIIEETQRHWRHAEPPLPRREETPLPLVGVHYRCDYGDGFSAGGWQLAPDNRDMPLLGYYASYQGTAIEQHLRWLADAGADFVLLNFHLDRLGADGHELTAAERILDVAEAIDSPLKFAIHLAPGIAAQGLDHLLTLLRHTLVRRSGYLHRNGQPVLGVEWPFQTSPAWFALLREHSEGFVRIACDAPRLGEQPPRPLPDGLFAGACPRAPLCLGGPSAREISWLRAYRAGAGDLRLWSISPGQHSCWTPAGAEPLPCPVPRDEGATYQRMMDFALGLDAPPDWVLVASFNDFAEGTHIEPSQEHGTLYLDLTRQFIHAVHARRKIAATASPRQVA